MPHLPYFILVTFYGGCVGSFLNVLAYRLPRGLSLVRPGSQCPKCDQPIAWYDNLPVLAWVLLRGRCRKCKATISVRYPLVELATAILFGGLFYVYYGTDLRPGFANAGLIGTWAVLIVHLTLVGCLMAAALIDAEYFIIPLPIPWLATAVGVVGLPVAVGLGWVDEISAQAVIPQVGVTGLFVAFGGAVGLLIALLLLRLKVIPRSFDEPVEEGKTVEEEVLGHPHPRREICKELLFVMWPVLGMVVGAMLGREVSGEPQWVWRVGGGVVLGYLVGAGVVWGVRIFGTLGFGKEAMGLGDVHLWGAVGCVIGALDVTVAFFIAPFFGIAAVLIAAGAAAIAKGRVRVIPYGPFLAAAAVVVMVARRPILDFLGIL